MSKTENTSEPSSDSGDLAEFETSLDELELLVGQMESGDLSLEESLQAFERGVALTRTCQKALKTAELRVQALTVTEQDHTAPNNAENNSPSVPSDG